MNQWEKRRKGWFCPRCNRVNAPEVNQCNCPPMKPDMAVEWNHGRHATIRYWRNGVGGECLVFHGLLLSRTDAPTHTEAK